jgi:hypothetical protein
MSAQRDEIVVQATVEEVRDVLLRPLEFPQWNPAFTTVAGREDPVAGERYELTIRSGLSGSLTYVDVEPERVAVQWSTVGFRESAQWTLEPTDRGTRVTHEFEHEGALAVVLRHAFRTVAQLRNERLAQRIGDIQRS